MAIPERTSPHPIYPVPDAPLAATNGPGRRPFGVCYTLAVVCALLGLAPAVVFVLAVFHLVSASVGFVAGWAMVLSLPLGMGLALVLALLGWALRRLHKR